MQLIGEEKDSTGESIRLPSTKALLVGFSTVVAARGSQESINNAKAQGKARREKSNALPMTPSVTITAENPKKGLSTRQAIRSALLRT